MGSFYNTGWTGHNGKAAERRVQSADRAFQREGSDRADALWHADVCHGPAMRIGGRTVPLRIHAILDDHSRYIVAIAATTTEREDLGEVDTADDVAADTRHRHALLARLMLLDGPDDFAEQALVGGAGLGPAPPKRTALPQRCEPQ